MNPLPNIEPPKKPDFWLFTIEGYTTVLLICLLLSLFVAGVGLGSLFPWAVYRIHLQLSFVFIVAVIGSYLIVFYLYNSFFDN